MELFKLTNWKRNIFKAKLFSHSDSVLGCSAERHNIHYIIRNKTQLCLTLLTAESMLTKAAMVSSCGARSSCNFFFPRSIQSAGHKPMAPAQTTLVLCSNRDTSPSEQNRSQLHGRITIPFPWKSSEFSVNL